MVRELQASPQFGRGVVRTMAQRPPARDHGSARRIPPLRLRAVSGVWRGTARATRSHTAARRGGDRGGAHQSPAPRHHLPGRIDPRLGTDRPLHSLRGSNGGAGRAAPIRSSRSRTCRWMGREAARKPPQGRGRRMIYLRRRFWGGAPSATAIALVTMLLVCVITPTNTFYETARANVAAFHAFTVIAPARQAELD